MVWAPVVPGHSATLPVGACTIGGPGGGTQRCAVSMMIMRPPQQGHGGRGTKPPESPTLPTAGSINPGIA